MSVVSGSAAVERAVLLARDATAPPGMSRVVLAIDGPGGSGKSTLAARVAARLDGAPVIHTDDFASWGSGLNWQRLLEQVLQPLSEAKPARYQRYDWDLQQLAEWHEVKPGEYLVIEGVSAARREFRPYLAATVWVSTAREECLRRGLERDGQEARGQWLQWQAAEDEYIARDQPDHVADLVVSGEGGEPWAGPNRPDKEQDGASEAARVSGQ